MSETYSKARTVAERAAEEAGELLLAAQGRVSSREKAPGDIVTEADFASQRLIDRRIKEVFPDHTLLAEEDDARPDPDNPWRWVVDPLDGTLNFAHGFPFWCVSIALEHEGRLVVGIVHDPIMRRTFSAAQDLGATLNGKPIRVSSTETLRTSLVTTGIPTDFAADAERQLAYFRRFSTGTHSIRRTGSTALNLSYVASGGSDVYYATSAHPWDIAAGVVLVREAGGKVSALDGTPHDLYQFGLVASNGLVHDESLRALDQAWPQTT